MKQDTLRACRALMAGGSRSFAAASRILPDRVAAPAAALYAFCRVADDAIDFSDDRPAALAALRARLDAIYAGAPGPELADQALAELVAARDLPRAPLDALLEGFAWDAEGRRYADGPALLDYAARVAGTVGLLMAVLMEVRDRPTLARAAELGLAMQLTNIARDVHEDALAGRLYLPLQWLQDEGIDPEAWLAAPVFDARLDRVMQRLLAEAERLYRRAECGVGNLPRDCRPGIQAARLVYAEIGHELERRGRNPLAGRVVVSRERKLLLMLQALPAALFAPGHPIDFATAAEAEAAIAPLVDAAARASLPERTFYQRTVRVIELFERTAERRRVQEPRWGSARGAT
jgi:15-cis-phytoene synthase